MICLCTKHNVLIRVMLRCSISCHTTPCRRRWLESQQRNQFKISTAIVEQRIVFFKIKLLTICQVVFYLSQRLFQWDSLSCLFGLATDHHQALTGGRKRCETLPNQASETTKTHANQALTITSLIITWLFTNNDFNVEEWRVFALLSPL